MPFYEYECPSCRYYLEVLQKITDRPLKKCPSCKKAGFKRLLSAPVFRLKGSGWYETDFKSDKDKQRNLAGADRDEAGAKATTGEAKSPAPAAGKDDKAAVKAEAKPPASPAAADRPAARSKKAAPARAAARGAKSATRPAARRATRPAARRKGRR